MTPDEERRLRLACQKWSIAKGQEKNANACRLAAEKEIAALVPGDDTKQVSQKTSDGTKATVKRSLKYKADIEEIRKIMEALERQVNRPVMTPIKSSTTHTLDVEVYEWYRNNAPAVHDMLSKHVEVSPAKESITVTPPKVKNG